MSAADAKEYRRQMRAKAERLGNAKTDPHRKVDASTWKPNEPLNTERKTGARPLRARIYKHGGAIQGDRMRHGGKAPRACGGGRMGRADGGRTGTGSLSMANVPDENKREKGSFHIGAYKTGGVPKPGASMKDIKGAVHKHEGHMHKGAKMTKLPDRKERASGGKVVVSPYSLEKGEVGKAVGASQVHEFGDMPSALKHLNGLIDSGTKPGRYQIEMNGERMSLNDAYRKHYGEEPVRTDKGYRYPRLRDKRARGGRTRGKSGKTNINIVIAQPGGGAPHRGPMPSPGPVMPPPMAAPPPAVPQGIGGPVPMMPPAGLAPPGAGPGGPMPRNAGGRTKRSYRSYKDMDAGALSGTGRLEKTEIQANKR